MDDEPDVGLVDAHAERARSNHGPGAPVEEPLELVRLLLVGKASMVERTRDAGLAEAVGQCRRSAYRRAVNETRAALGLGQEPPELAELVLVVVHRDSLLPRLLALRPEAH